LDPTARYTRVATGLIASIESPLDRLTQFSEEGAAKTVAPELLASFPIAENRNLMTLWRGAEIDEIVNRKKVGHLH
jgi:hypothetical protein